MSDTINVNGSYREGDAVLRTEGLVKRYGKRTVVNDVSINVRQGEIVGLLGPNGAGIVLHDDRTRGAKRRAHISRCSRHNRLSRI